MNVQNEEETEEQTVAKSFTQALKEKYLSDSVGFDANTISVIISPKRRNATAELGHLRTIVLDNMNVVTADIPNQGLMSLCPNVVDLDLTNNLLDKWSELLAILSHMPQLKFVNASRNNLNVDTEYHDLPKTPLNIENLALNSTGITIDDMIHISQIMPTLKELHLCGNDYEHLGSIDERIKAGSFSSLECLRLNNNKIKSWTEVWKLRHLRGLKSLIMSDNPVSDFFYNHEENEDESATIEMLQKEPSDCQETSSDTCQLLDLDDFDLQVLRNDDTIKNKWSDGFDNVEDRHAEHESNDDRPIPDELERPVSRLSRHEESDPEDGYNNEEMFFFDSTPEEQCDGDANSCAWLDTSKSSYDSFNTNPTITDDDSSDIDMCKDCQCQNNYDNDKSEYALMAKSFLDDILNSIDFVPPDAVSLSTVPRGVYLNFASDDTSDDISWMLPTSSSDSGTRNKNVNETDIIKSQNNEMKHQCCQRFDAITPNDGHTEIFTHPSSNNGERNKIDIDDHFENANKYHTPAANTKCQEQTKAGNSGEQTINMPCECHASVLNEDHLNGSNQNSSSHCQLRHRSSMSEPDDGVEKSKPNPSCGDTCSDSSDNPSKTVTGTKNGKIPFENLEMLCLSNANLSHWKDLDAFSSFPKLKNLRLQCNPLYSSVDREDRRKLYIASLPNVNTLNGSEVSGTEREKAESYYLRHFMHKEEKSDIYHSLVKKHGEPVELVEVDLSAGYQEWALLDFICDGDRKFSKKVHLTDQVGRLRKLISETLLIPKNSFNMHYNPCSTIHPEYEREMTELRCESLPMSRFDFADGDEIHIKIPDS